MEVSVLTLISVPEGRFCCALALKAVRPAKSVAKSIRFIMVVSPIGPLEMDALSELRVVPLALQSWNSRAARQSCCMIHGSATLGIKELLVCNGYFLPAPVDMSRCPKRAQLWWAAKMAATCWSILRAKSGSAVNSRRLSLHSGHFWLQPSDRPC